MDLYKSRRCSVSLAAVLLCLNLGFSQSNDSTQSTLSMEFLNGISLPLGDLDQFAEQGFISNIQLNKNFCSGLSLGMQTSYLSLPLSNSLGNRNDQWTSFAFGAGPRYRIETSKVFAQFHARVGIAFVSIPEYSEFYPQTMLEETRFEDSSVSGFNSVIGLNLGTTLCENLEVFISSEYLRSININYQTKDFSSIIIDGEINQDLADTVFFEDQELSISTLNIMLGVRWIFNSHSSRATDYNSSRSNKSYGKKLDDDTGEDGNNNSRATDYNSSRSNKSYGKDLNSNDGQDGNNGTRATDYNSSRSNKSYGKKLDDDTGEGGNNNSRATDYNSSRSNKSYGKKLDSDDGEGGNKGTRATDYNSSRSNKSYGKDLGGDKDDDDNKGTRATDYNSSRSNKSYGKKLDDDTSEDGNNNSRATDYNSSRSNKSYEINLDEGETEEILLQGRLTGIFMASRKFEFITSENIRLNGSIDPAITEVQLNSYMNTYLGKSCRIRVLVSLATTDLGQPTKQYTLVALTD